MNAAKQDGKNTWTIADVHEEVKKVGGWDVWYKTFGKAEGFARGGITPANRLYVTGENGPEIVTSPQQWGVLSHEASQALFERDNPALPANAQAMDSRLLEAIAAKLADLIFYARQTVYKTDQIAANTGRNLDLLKMWDAEGLPKEEDAA